MNLNDTRDGTPPLSDQSFSSTANSLLATPLVDLDDKVRDLEHINHANLGPALARKGSEIDDAETQALLFSLTSTYTRLDREEPVPVITFPKADIQLSAWLPIDDDSIMDDAALFIVDIVNRDPLSDDQVYADSKVPTVDFHLHDSLLAGLDTSRARIMQDALPIDCELSGNIPSVPIAAHAELVALAAEFTMHFD